MFESEGEVLLKNKKQELQRYIDTIFIDNELMLLPCVVRFFELQKRYDYVIPRMAPNKWNEIMSINEKSKEPIKDFADNLRKEYSKLKLENAALKSRAQELILNEAAANIKVGSLSERVEYYKEAEALHDREVASIRGWATTAIATLKDQLSSKQREIDTLIKNTNTLEERNVELRSELSNLREKSATCSTALDTKTKLCAVLEKRVTELEATCAAQRSTIMWANRELDLWRLGGESPEGNPSTTETKVAGPTANAYEEKWREAQVELQAIQLRSEQLAERVRTLEALNESGVFENGRGNRRGSVCGMFHGAQGRDTELRMDVIGARNGCTDRNGKNELHKLVQANREKDLDLELVRKELETVRAEGKRAVEQVEILRAERQKDSEHFLSLDSTIKEKEAKIRTLNGNIFQQELLIWLLEFQNRELLQEVGSLTLSLDKLGEAPAKETERTRLMYSGQYLEGLDALEVVEKQNSFMKDKIHELNAELSRLTESSSTEITTTKLELDRCRAELKGEHDRSQRLALLASKNGLKTEDIGEDEFTSVLSLKGKIRKLEAEVGDIKQRYFFYLAMTIKLQTGGRCQLDELYNELLAEKSVPIDGWSKWINMKMRSSLKK